MKYVGHLPGHDRLYDYLRYEIMPQTGADGRAGFRVFANRSSHAVYIYEDIATGQRVVGKFFNNGSNFEHAGRKMYRELNNINEFRTYLGKYHYAARVLGCNESLNCLLVTEYCFGEPMDEIILRAIYGRGADHLYRKLTALALFSATVHNRSARPEMVDFQSVCNYFENIVDNLHNVADETQRNCLKHLCSKWRHEPLMYQDQKVLVHGDATPANFFFGDGLHVITFDLERMHRNDRVFDIGRIVGELQHFFLFNTANKYAAEPFIRHFLYEYSSHFPNRESAFTSITKRVPFYMAVNLLRISRNSYLPFDYRKKLVHEAIITLKSGWRQK